MPTVYLDIKGIKELDRAFRELPVRLANKVIRQAMRKALTPIRSRIQDTAPRETGELKRMVKIRAGKRKKGEINMSIRVNPKEPRGDDYYGMFPEFGVTKGPRLQPAQHFTKRAFDSTKNEALARVESEIAAGIEREARS